MSQTIKYKTEVVATFLLQYKINEVNAWGIDTQEGVADYYDRIVRGYVGEVTFWTDGQEAIADNAKTCRIAIRAKDAVSRKKSFFEFDI